MGVSSQTLSAGYFHTLALQEDGTVVAWGGNDDGLCDVPSGLKAVAVSAGNYLSLALKEDGTVVAWGKNDFGQCDVPSGLKAVAVSAGNFHSLALKEDGTMVAWGWNTHGQCDVPSGLKAVAVSAGNYLSLALKEDGTVVAWGKNDYGQCDVPSGLKAVAVSAGAFHTLALQEDGTMVAWGGNTHGLCDVPSGLKAVAVSAGPFQSLALKEDGTVVAWGWNTHGQCDVPSGLKAVAVSAGDFHSLALQEDGTVVAWGRNDFGQCDVPSGLKAAINDGHTQSRLTNIIANKPPPMLVAETSTIRLQGSSLLKGKSENAVLFDLTNSDGGTGYGLIVKTTIVGDAQGLAFDQEQSLTPLKVGETRQVSVPITTNRNTVDGLVIVKIEVVEPRGFSTTPFNMEILTESFREPEIKVADFVSSSAEWSPNTPIELDILVQNMGRGDAYNVRVELELPSGVVCFSNNEVTTFESLPKGEVQKVSYDLMVPRTFQAKSIKANLTLSESFGDYGSSWSHTFPFKGQEEQAVIVVAGEREGQGIDVPKATFGNASSTGGEIIFNQTNASHVISAIAVIPKDGENCSGRTVSGDDLAVLGETAMLGLYTVVDRKFFEQTLEEIKLSMTGLTFENGVLEAGCIENAQGYLFVEYGCLQNQETIKAKLIHCESSEIIWNGLGQGTTASETFEEIVSKLENP